MEKFLSHCHIGAMHECRSMTVSLKQSHQPTVTADVAKFGLPDDKPCDVLFRSDFCRVKGNYVAHFFLYSARLTDES